MARNTQLLELLTMLRAEAGHSTTTAIGVDNTPNLLQKLRRTQELLYDDYDWPFLRKVYPIALVAGQRYYDLPILTEKDNQFATTHDAGLNMERIESVAINYSGKPIPLDRGIGWNEYAQYNSDDATPPRANPCRRWDIKRTTSAKEQIEVWPIPADNSQTILFKGIRKLRPLVDVNDDVADLDDQLIVLTCAAEILARAEAKDAKLVANAAEARRKTLQGRSKGASRMITMSGSSASPNKNLGRTIIRIGSSTN